MKKKTISLILLITLPIIILYFSLKDNFSEVMRQMISLNPIWLIVAFSLVIGYWFFQSLAMKKFANKFDDKFSLEQSFRIILITQFFNSVTPFQTGGQPYQLYALKKEKIGIVNATNIIIENFIVYQISLILLGLIAVISNSVFHLYTKVPILKTLVIIGFLINLLVTLVLFMAAFMKRTNKFISHFCINLLHKLKIVKNKEDLKTRFNNYINRFHDGAKKLVADKKTFIITILYNFIALLLLYATPLIILYSMGDYTSINILSAIITSAYVMIIGAFVPMPGGTGGLEYSFTQFYGFFITGSTLTTVMLVWRFLTYYFGMIVGAIALNIRKKEG